jgi:hypothetical protein
MTIYQKDFAELAPELNPVHVESLAYLIGSTLNGMPKEFFDDVVALARRMGADRLAQIHADAVI